MPPDSTALRRVAHHAWALVPALGLGLALVLRIGDGDVWWHVATGEWILANGAIPRTDPFSHTAPGPWHYTDAAAQVLYALAHRVGGPPALTALHAVLGGVLAGLLALATRARPGAAIAATGLAAAASHAAMAAKPQIFSYLLFVVLLAWLPRLEAAPPTSGRARLRSLAFALALGLAWGWLHRGGVLGLAVAAAAPVAWALDRSRRPLVPLGVGITLALGLGLAANPGGAFYFTSALDLAGRSSFRELLVDWQAPSLALIVDRHLALLPLLALALIERLRSRRVDVELLVLLGTAVLASRSVRFVPFFAFASALPASRALDAMLDALAVRARSVRPAILGMAAAALGLAALGAHHATHVVPAYVGFGAMEARLPVALSEWLRAHPPPGARWNGFDLGGYLLYALAPEQPVFIDGRNDTVYEDELFRAALASAHDPDVFAALAERYRIGHAVLSWRDVSRSELWFLHSDPEWALVYWDDVGAVLVRRTEAAAEYLARHAYRELRVDTAFPRVERLAARSASTWSPDEHALAREILRNAEQAPSSIRAAFLAALVMRASGDPRYGALRDDVHRRAEELGLPLRLP